MVAALTRRALLSCLMAAACGGKQAAPPTPELVIVGESTRVRLEGARPATTAWFDGQRISLTAARGESLG